LREVIEAIRSGSMTSVEAVTQSIATYNQRECDINAFISFDAEAAMMAARHADALYADRRDTAGSLHGVPLAYKDMFDRVGHSCSFGSRIRQSCTPNETAGALQRFEGAGGILMGALNMSEFALGPTGHNATFGHCRNPWDPLRIAGGSSSGAGAAVAAGVVYGALGSDTGGSIRIPAACCGVVGLKPTHGLISLMGAMPLAPSLDCIGPIARTVDDCTVLFDVLTGCDAHSYVPARQCPTGPPPRLVYPRAELDREISSDVRAALDGAAEVFRRLGFEVIDGPLPDVSHLHELADAIQQPESAASHYTTLRDHREAYSRHVRRRIEGGFLVSAPAYIHALQQRAQHLRSFVEVTLAAAGALLMPTIGFAIPTLAETDEDHAGAQPQLVRRMTRWTRWLNYLGVPAISIPCGRDSHGMPIGMQLVARPLEERYLLEIGRRYESGITEKELSSRRRPDGGP
jgi:aspartyl-tRNA(Asn)/glutamyl-tRNA(Gln) amidotransferase subunit A